MGCGGLLNVGPEPHDGDRNKDKRPASSEIVSATPISASYPQRPPACQPQPPPPEMPHKVFEIDETLRLIAGHIAHLGGSSAISFACCCRAFEEPVLSLCWEYQPLDKLASVLPEGVLKRSGSDRSPYYVCTPGTSDEPLKR